MKQELEETRVCVRCGEEFPIEEFLSRFKGTFNTRRVCRECYKARAKELLALSADVMRDEKTKNAAIKTITKAKPLIKRINILLPEEQWEIVKELAEADETTIDDFLSEEMALAIRRLNSQRDREFYIKLRNLEIKDETDA